MPMRRQRRCFMSNSFGRQRYKRPVAPQNILHALVKLRIADPAMLLFIPLQGSPDALALVVRAARFGGLTSRTPGPGGYLVAFESVSFLGGRADEIRWKADVDLWADNSDRASVTLNGSCNAYVTADQPIPSTAPCPG